jgi:DNA-binding HxlR family transcriptional regulator
MLRAVGDEVGKPAVRERNYRQYCGLAAALDTVGERWTLLIVRELLLGPRRYTALLADLPGIGTNLLAGRLKKLCTLGLVQRIGAIPGHSYRLTERGEELRGPVLALSRWGMALLGDPSADAVVRPRWGFLAIQAMADASKLPGVSEQYEFRVDEEVFHLHVHDGQAVPATGPAMRASMAVVTDATTFVQLGAGLITPLEAVEAGQLTLSGDPAAVLRCSMVLGLATPAT